MACHPDSGLVFKPFGGFASVVNEAGQVIWYGFHHRADAFSVQVRPRAHRPAPHLRESAGTEVYLAASRVTAFLDPVAAPAGRSLFFLACPPVSNASHNDRRRIPGK